MPTGRPDFSFLHFQPQVVAFASSLTHSGEHRVTPVSTGNTSNHLGQNHGLAQTSSPEQTRLTAADERRQKVNHLNPGFEDFGLGT